MMYNMSFEENENDSDGSEVETDEVGRPQFSEINKNSGFLDKELAASGFTRKDQDELEKLTDGELEKYSDSDDEGTGDEEDEEDINNTNVKQLESLHMAKEDDNHQAGDEHDPEDEGEAESEDVAELEKSLSKQRRKAIQAAHRGKRNFASRNAYKDKGGKSSQSSKVHKQFSGW